MRSIVGSMQEHSNFKMVLAHPEEDAWDRESRIMGFLRSHPRISLASNCLLLYIPQCAMRKIPECTELSNEAKDPSEPLQECHMLSMHQTQGIYRVMQIERGDSHPMCALLLWLTYCTPSNNECELTRMCRQGLSARQARCESTAH